MTHYNGKFAISVFTCIVNFTHDIFCFTYNAKDPAWSFHLMTSLSTYVVYPVEITMK